MPGKILIKIDKQGKVKIDVQGIKGESCIDITRAFEEALGNIEDIEYKPAYFMESEQVEQEIHEENE